MVWCRPVGLKDCAFAVAGGAEGCHRVSVGVTGEISMSDRRSDGRG